MKFFPVFIRLRGRRVAVAGGGEQAAQKVRLLAKTGAAINVFSPAPSAELRRLAGRGAITLARRNFRDTDADGAALVFAAAGDARMDKKVSAAAQARNIPVNTVDRPALCTFYTPALVDRDPVVVAVGTEGAAPVLARRIKSTLETMLPPATGALAKFAQSLRAEVAETVPPSRVRAFWENFFAHASAGRTATLIAQGRFPEARRAAQKLLARARVKADGMVSVLSAPADAELLTLKAVRKLQEADVIVHDCSVGGAILEYARRDAERVDAGGGDVHRQLISHVKAGRNVACISAPGTVISATAINALRAGGITVDVVPGIRSPALITVAPKPPPPLHTPPPPPLRSPKELRA